MTRWIDAPDWTGATADVLVAALAAAYPTPHDARLKWRRLGMDEADFPLNWTTGRQLWAVAAQAVSLAGRLEQLVVSTQAEWPALRDRLDTVLTAAPGAGFVTSAHRIELTDDQEDTLRRILHGAAWTDAIPAAYLDVARRVNGIPPYPGDLWLAVDTLRTAVSALPLCEFLVRIANGPDRATARRLWAWLRDTAPGLGVDVKKLERLGRRLRRPTLSVRVVPDVLTPGLHVTIWSRTTTDGWQAAASSAEPWTWDTIAEQLGVLLAEILRHNGLAPLIEFVLPDALLTRPVEKLEVDLSEGAYHLGRLCPVVVRPLDHTAVAGRDQKWQALVNDTSREFQVVPAGSMVSAAVRPETVCLGVVLGRDTGPAALPQTLTAAFQAGISAVLWHRPTGVRHRDEVALTSILRGRTLSRLPDVVCDQRVAAHERDAPADHPGRDVVLLWDNPLWQPPRMPWRPPT